MSLTAHGQQQAESLVYNIKSELILVNAQIAALEVERLHAYRINDLKKAQEMVVGLKHLRDKLGYVEYLCRNVDLHGI